jgi:hypothetical protein
VPTIICNSKSVETTSHEIVTGEVLIAALVDSKVMMDDHNNSTDDRISPIIIAKEQGMFEVLIEGERTECNKDVDELSTLTGTDLSQLPPSSPPLQLQLSMQLPSNTALRRKKSFSDMSVVHKVFLRGANRRNNQVSSSDESSSTTTSTMGATPAAGGAGANSKEHSLEMKGGRASQRTLELTRPMNIVLRLRPVCTAHTLLKLPTSLFAALFSRRSRRASVVSKKVIVEADRDKATYTH